MICFTRCSPANVYKFNAALSFLSITILPSQLRIKQSKAEQVKSAHFNLDLRGFARVWVYLKRHVVDWRTSMHCSYKEAPPATAPTLLVINLEVDPPRCMAVRCGQTCLVCRRPALCPPVLSAFLLAPLQHGLALDLTVRRNREPCEPIADIF